MKNTGRLTAPLSSSKSTLTHLGPKFWFTNICDVLWDFRTRNFTFPFNYSMPHTIKVFVAHIREFIIKLYSGNKFRLRDHFKICPIFDSRKILNILYNLCLAYYLNRSRILPSSFLQHKFEQILDVFIKRS